MSSYWDKEGNRLDPYKEDSTVGRSIISPKNYKGDIIVQVWMDTRVMATLSNWLEKRGIYTRHLSVVAREPLEMLIRSLVNEGEIEMVEDTIEARTLLERRFGIGVERKGRGRKNVLHNQVLSNMREESNIRVREKRADDLQAPLKNRITRPPPTAEELSKVLEMFKQIQSDENKVDRDKIIADAHAAGVIVKNEI